MTGLLPLHLLFCITCALASDLVEDDISTVAVVGFALCGIIVGLLFIGLFTICLRCYRTRLRQRRDKMLTTANETQPPLAPISARPSPPPQSISSYGLGCPPRSLSSSFYDIQSQPYPSASGGIYPSLSGYVHQNPMTVSSHSAHLQPDYSIEPRIERQNAVLAAAPIASLESIPNEDLSDGSVYHRFFGPNTDTPKSSPDPPSGYPPPPTSVSPTTPSNITRASRISNALRDAARRLRLGGDSQQQEDTVTLEDGNSSVPSGSVPMTRSNLSGSQVRLFKQQKRPKRLGTMGVGLSGSKLGRRSKASTVSQDSGHCNTFDVTELDEMESSVDNDHFLLSLESAIFTTAPTCGGVTAAVTPLYSPTFQEGDLGDAGSVESGLGGWKDGLHYPPLPPGLPVVGFAYLGLGGVEEYEEEEDEMVDVEKGDWRRDEVKLHNELHESASTIGTDLGRAATPPLEEEVRLRANSSTFDRRDRTENQLNSPDSESSATAMLPSAHGLRQSVSVSDLDNRPSSTNLETWMSISDEHLLISPTGGEVLASVGSQAKDAHLFRSLSSKNLSKE
ncbi:hypothetical protein TcWFU_002043 [Taenia crassiceps]|uniref:Uncharacterized protein n=1 Tax=Taenia crassiceps TaxID=6207 RepID=A0ABR4Q8I6_9CEST